jgi:AraC-like DNA-binding protein
MEAYQDEGCDLFPSCLNCPLSQCRYDEPGRRQKGKELRNKEMMRIHKKEGLRIRELADRFGVSKRTVHRIIGRNTGEEEL